MRRRPGAQWPVRGPRIFQWLEEEAGELTTLQLLGRAREVGGMKAPAVRLDFAAPRVRTTLPGVLLLVVGIGAVTGDLSRVSRCGGA